MAQAKEQQPNIIDIPLALALIKSNQPKLVAPDIPTVIPLAACPARVNDSCFKFFSRSSSSFYKKY